MAVTKENYIQFHPEEAVLCVGVDRGDGSQNPSYTDPASRERVIY